MKSKISAGGLSVWDALWSACRPPAVGAGFIPEADVHGTGTAFVVSVDLPGVREASLDITVEGSTLTIRGQRNAGGPRDENLA